MTAGAVIRECFAAVLDVDPGEIADDTDFFLLGGHSLLALDLAVAIESRLGVPVRVRDVYDCATPGALAGRVAAGRMAAGTAAGPDRPGSGGPDGTGGGVDAGLRWLWLDRQTGGRPGASYTVPALFEAGPDLDLDRFGAAVEALVRRHPALRTVFAEERGELRTVLTDRPATVRVVELDGPEAVRAYVAGAVTEPFDPAVGPLVRVSALHRGDGAWSVLLVADHLVCDGRGLQILARDLARGYADPALLADPPARATPPPPDLESELAFWRDRLTPWPEPLPLPVLRDRTGPVDRTAVTQHELPPEVVAAVTRRAAAAHAGPFVPLAAAVARGIGEITGRTDVCLGTAVDRRARDRADDVIGFHVSTVVLRLAPDPGATPDAAVRAAAAGTMDAIDHSGVHFGQLVTELAPPRRPWRNPIFDVWVVVYPYIDTGPGPLRLRGGPVLLPGGLFELSFQFVEHPGGLRMDLQYDTARYDEVTAGWIADRVLDSVRWLAAADPAPQPEPEPADAFGGFRYDT